MHNSINDLVEVSPASLPQKKKLVDIFGVILFVIMLTVWIYIGIFAHLRGSGKHVNIPQDSYGQLCEKDFLVRHKPYLFYFDITLCNDESTVGCNSRTVCVEKCPTDFFLSSRASDLTNKSIFCQKGSIKWNKEDCASWYLPSTSVNSRCVPNLEPNETILKEISFIKNVTIHAQAIKEATRIIKSLSNITLQSEYFISEVIQSPLLIFIGAVFPIIFCIIHFYYFTKYPKIIFIFTLVAVPALLTACLSYVCFSYISLILQSIKKSLTDTIDLERTIWFSGLLVLSTATIFLIFMTMCWIKETFKSVTYIELCKHTVSDVYATFPAAIISWILHLFCFVFALSAGLHLSNIIIPATFKINYMGDNCHKYLLNYSNSVVIAVCDPDYAKIRNNTFCKAVSCDITKRTTESHPFFHFVNAFSYIWMIFFLFALEDMVIGLLMHHWYISNDKSTFSGSNAFKYFWENFFVVIVYHIGTAVIGSLLIALYKYLFLKVVFIWTAKKSKTSKAISKLHNCFIFCKFIEATFEVVDTQVLILSVVNNKSFLRSTKVYKKLIESPSGNKISDYGCIYYILYYQKLWITLGCGSLAFIYVKFLMPSTSTSFSVFIIIFTLWIAYATVCFIFSIYTVKLDTLIICLLKDLEENNGSASKPFLSTASIIEILVKK